MGKINVTKAKDYYFGGAPVAADGAGKAGFSGQFLAR